MASSTAHDLGDVENIARKLLSTLCRPGNEFRMSVSNDNWQIFYKNNFIATGVGESTSIVVSLSDFLAKFPDIFYHKTTNGKDGEVLVEARVKLSICRDYTSKEGCLGLNCTGLHCCRHFLFRKCTKKNCKAGHDLTTDHNKQRLTNSLLDHFKIRQVQLLMKHSHPDESIPQPCKFYNNKGGCKNGDKCFHLHVCKFYLDDSCTMGSKCPRSHDATTPHVQDMLQKYGTTFEELTTAFKRVKIASKPAVVKLDPDDDDAEKDDDESHDICIYHLIGKCSYGDKCHNHHSSQALPFQWQYKHPGQEWTNFGVSDNTAIEANFCNPQNDQYQLSTDKMINFLEMNVRESAEDVAELRRLGTVTSVKVPPTYLFTTLWIWYWRDKEHGKWTEYNKEDVSNNDQQSSVSIEKAYVANPDSQIPNTVGAFTYTLDLKTMRQTNCKTQAQCEIRRRPDVFNAETKMPKRNMSDSSVNAPTVETKSEGNKKTYPPTWKLNKSANEELLVETVLRTGETAEEFVLVEKRFHETLPDVVIKTITRIENADLWNAFYLTQVRLEKKLPQGNRLKIEHLFHGTRDELIDPIVQQGFDPRVSGMSVGTLYGKGSYFAKHAKYSNDYARKSSATQTKKMFLVRVIVGDYTVGTKEMCRPPPKDPTKPFDKLFDSCVNSMNDPRIFVAFDRYQCYPEWLIEY